MTVLNGLTIQPQPNNSASVIVMLRAEQNKDAHLLRERRRIMRPVYISSNIVCRDQDNFYLPWRVKMVSFMSCKELKKTISRVENFYAEMLDISNDNCLANKLQIVHVSCRIESDK